MKVIIAGSRDIDDYDALWALMLYLGIEDSITEIVSGKARGVDTLGEGYARDLSVPLKEFPAKWDDLEADFCSIKVNSSGREYNACAGFARNEDMAKYADVCVILRYPDSRGSLDMLKRAKAHKLRYCDAVYMGRGQASIIREDSITH